MSLWKDICVSTEIESKFQKQLEKSLNSEEEVV